MSIQIHDRHGNEVTVYISTNGGMVDAIVRADTREDFEAAALSRKLLVTDEDDNNVPAPGVYIDVLGPVTVTPAVLDDEGNVSTPAVTDNRYHVNIRITGAALQVKTRGFPNWKQTAITWTNHGVPDVAVNRAEKGLKLSKVTLLDPDSIKSPARVWA